MFQSKKINYKTKENSKVTRRIIVKARRYLNDMVIVDTKNFQEKIIRNKKKPVVWRIIVGILSILFIVFMWVRKDIVSIYTTMPSEQVLPLIATTVAVSLIKVAAIAAAVFLVKWIVGRVRKKK